MADRLVIHLTLPGRGVSSNHHGHFGKRAKDAAQWRMEAYLRAKSALASAAAAGDPFTAERIRVWAVWFMGGPRLSSGGKPVKVSDGRYRPLDASNAAHALKPAIDGLVDAGVVPADDHSRVQVGDQILARTLKEHAGRSGVILCIEDATSSLSGNDRATIIGQAAEWL